MYEQMMQKQAVERMHADLRYAQSYEDRARALDGLGMLLECETPGTVHEVTVKRGRWWHRNKTDANAEPKEIVLSADERREFAAWCAGRAVKLRAQSEEINLKYAVKQEGADHV
jgi:hypothetical protein